MRSIGLALLAVIGSDTPPPPTDPVSIVAAQKIVDHAVASWGVTYRLHFFAAVGASRTSSRGYFHVHEIAPA